jgi:hypothetical protein
MENIRKSLGISNKILAKAQKLLPLKNLVELQIKLSFKKCLLGINDSIFFSLIT